jgi:hypothetical protein
MDAMGVLSEAGGTLIHDHWKAYYRYEGDLDKKGQKDARKRCRHIIQEGENDVLYLCRILRAAAPNSPASAFSPAGQTGPGAGALPATSRHTKKLPGPASGEPLEHTLPGRKMPFLPAGKTQKLLYLMTNVSAAGED